MKEYRVLKIDEHAEFQLNLEDGVVQGGMIDVKDEYGPITFNMDHLRDLSDWLNKNLWPAKTIFPPPNEPPAQVKQFPAQIADRTTTHKVSKTLTPSIEDRVASRPLPDLSDTLMEDFSGKITSPAKVIIQK